MKKYFIVILLLTVAANLFASPLHSKLKHSIIIDTDCNDNDLRAIIILLSHPGITVKAIIITEGELQEDKGKLKIRNLLTEYGADTIPVGLGSEIIFTNNILYNTILSAKESMTIVCLGPLTNISNFLKENKPLYKNIEELVWYNDAVLPFNGFNYKADMNSAELLFKTEIDIDIISNLKSEINFFDKGLIKLCRESGTKMAKSFSRIPLIKSPSERSGLKEELAAFFLANPELFEMDLVEKRPNVHYNKEQSIPAIKDVISDMLKEKYKTGHFVAMYGFPVDRELYVYDIRQIMDSAITRYGIDEWKACVMTDEFHGHLGVFSIVGAKMGIRAREFFGIGTDLLEVSTYAGSKEPYSCMNDGIQVSTGATLGQGSIHLADETIAIPQAIFTYNGQSILIKLKSEYLKELQAVINEGVNNYGLQDEDYWTLIRQTSIKYWLEWDRKEIFDLVIL